jgi:hypothetical protein
LANLAFELERHNETHAKTLTKIIKYLRQQVCISSRCLITPMLELFKTSKEICMNKLIASLIVGAFSAAAFATTPVAPVATPATAAPAVAAVTAKAEAAPAAKAEAKKVVKEKKVAAKADATKKVEATAPAAAAVIK